MDRIPKRKHLKSRRKCRGKEIFAGKIVTSSTPNKYRPRRRCRKFLDDGYFVVVPGYGGYDADVSDFEESVEESAVSVEESAVSVEESAVSVKESKRKLRIKRSFDSFFTKVKSFFNRD